MEAIEALRSRRSVRRFRTDAVPRETLIQLIEEAVPRAIAARHASLALRRGDDARGQSAPGR